MVTCTPSSLADEPGLLVNAPRQGSLDRQSNLPTPLPHPHFPQQPLCLQAPPAHLLRWMLLPPESLSALLTHAGPRPGLIAVVRALLAWPPPCMRSQ